MHGDKYLGIAYSALVPVLVGALQEMDQKLDAAQKELRAALESHKEEIALLKEELRRLRQEQSKD